MANIAVYEPSGRIDLGTLPAGLIGGVIGGVVCAWVYQFLVDWIPSVYLSVAATVFFGIAVGSLMLVILRRFYCRNMMVARLLTLLVAGVAISASFGFAYLRLVQQLAKDHKTTVTEVRMVVPFSKYIETRVETGWTVGHTGSGAPLNGVMVWILWGLESIIVVGCALMVVSALKVPFCEDCQQWLAERTVGFRSGVTPARLKEEIAGGSLETLLGVSGGDATAAGSIEYQARSCDGCLQNHYLSIIHHYSVTNSKGQAQAKKDFLIEHAQTDQRTLQRLESLLIQESATVPAPPSQLGNG